MNQPAVVFVHGFWRGAAHWGKVIVELDRRGFGALHAVENPLTSLADDAHRTQQMVTQIDGPVLLVGHSYGGAVITEAGDLPNVVGLVYVAAFALDEGESLGALLAQGPTPAALAHAWADAEGFQWLSEDDYVNHFAPDVHPTQARAALALKTKSDNATPAEVTRRIAKINRL